MAKLPTVRIQHPDLPGGMVILASDFREDVHTRFTPTAELEAADVLAVQSEQQSQRAARVVELQKQSAKEVRAILERRGVFINKADAIEAIVTGEFGPAVEPPVLKAEDAK